MIRLNNRGLEFGFEWLFAIIVGAVILFFAIFFVSRFSGTQKEAINLEIAKEISSALSPFETGVASGKAGKLEFSQDTRILNDCSVSGVGRQLISVSTKSFNQWSEQGGQISIKDRYVFSNRMIEGKIAYLFSKDFHFPFKAGSIIVLYSDNYCFKDTPDEFKYELEKLSIGNIKFSQCGQQDIEVCFERECDVSIYGTGGFDKYRQGYVRKDGETIFYANELLYGAIFSEHDVYECNVKRIMKRVSELSKLYGDENIIYGQGCGIQIYNSLSGFSAKANNLKSSEELIFPLKIDADTLDDEHSQLSEVCKLW